MRKPVKRIPLRDWLVLNDACWPAQNWVAKHHFTSLWEVWQACQNPSWLGWVLRRLPGWNEEGTRLYWSGTLFDAAPPGGRARCDEIRAAWNGRLKAAMKRWERGYA